MSSDVSVKSLIHEIGERLQSVSLYRGFAEARLLVARVLECEPDRLLVEDSRLVSESDQEKIESLVSRRLNYEPVAYLTGEKEFYGISFFVSPHVLIPRPETESLVSGVLKWVKAKNLSAGKILDLGTGSGCIGLSLARELGTNFNVLGLDISKEALKVADTNMKKLGLNNFRCEMGDILKPFLGSERFDIIVSNPPYIPSSEIPKLQEDIRNFEPKTALDGGSRGLDFYGSIFSNWRTRLNSTGLIAVETLGPAQQAEMKSSLRIEGAQSIWFDGPHVFYEYTP